VSILFLFLLARKKSIPKFVLGLWIFSLLTATLSLQPVRTWQTLLERILGPSPAVPGGLIAQYKREDTLAEFALAGSLDPNLLGRVITLAQDHSPEFAFIDGDTVYWIDSGPDRSIARFFKLSVADQKPVKFMDTQRIVTEASLQLKNFYFSTKHRHALYWIEKTAYNFDHDTPFDLRPFHHLTGNGQDLFWFFHNEGGDTIISRLTEKNRSYRVIHHRKNCDDSCADLAATDTSLFFPLRDEGQIIELPIEGGIETVLAEGQDFPTEIDVSTTHLAWSSKNSITAYDRQAKKIHLLVNDLPETPHNLVLHRNFAYWLNSSQINRISLHGGSVELIATNQLEPRSLDVSDQFIVWGNLGAIPVPARIWNTKWVGRGLFLLPFDRNLKP